jgi:signal peptidase II
MKIRNFVALLAVVGSCVGCDQVTKHAAQLWLRGAPGLSFWGDSVRLLYAENRGAFLSLGAGWPDPIRFWVFTLFSLGFVIITLVWVWNRSLEPWTRPQQLTVLGGTLLAAGGLGNVVDRLFRGGAVVDFMNLGIGSLRTGIFNVADVQIVVGIALLALVGRAEASPQPSRASVNP